LDDGLTRLERFFFALHAIWAVPCIGAIGFLATATTGHPPGIILIPVVLIVWISGHLLLWGSGRIVARRVTQPSGAITRTSEWPLGIVVTMAVAGITAFAAFWLLAWLLVDAGGQGNGISVAVLTVVVPVHGAVFVDLMTRRPWALGLAGLAWLGWFLIVALQLASYLFRGSRVAPTELILALVLLVALGFMAYHIQFGHAPRAFANKG
jgi:hypothetical protein